LSEVKKVIKENIKMKVVFVLSLVVLSLTSNVMAEEPKKSAKEIIDHYMKLPTKLRDSTIEFENRVYDKGEGSFMKFQLSYKKSNNVCKLRTFADNPFRRNETTWRSQNSSEHFCAANLGHDFEICLVEFREQGSTEGTITYNDQGWSLRVYSPKNPLIQVVCKAREK
jgi:hypothetical protein